MRQATDVNHPTPYPELDAVLAELVARVEAMLGDRLVGAYLQGSFAVGDFDVDSDVDFVIVTEDDLGSGEAAALTAMHEEVYRLPSTWAQHLEGSYFPREVLRANREPREELWYLDHGSQVLVRSTHCNTSIVRWVLREQGVALAGPPPAMLVDPIPVEVLRREISATIRDWGTEILRDPSAFENRFFQGFILLSYCRMLHDLHTGRPGSKRAGAEWAKSHFGGGWPPLIDRAWETRPDPATSVRQEPDRADFEATLRFVAEVMQRATEYVDREQR